MEPRPIRIEGDTAYVTLTQGLEAIIDAADAPLVDWRNWCVQRGGNTQYAASAGGRVNGKSGPMILMHRVICNAEFGKQVDHINRNGLDNRRINLSVGTCAQNQWNAGMRKDNRTGEKGVFIDRRTGKFFSQVQVNGIRHSVGTFDNIEDAARAYAERASYLRQLKDARG